MDRFRFHLTRSRLILSIKATAVILATAAFYFQDLTIVASEAINNGLVSYILAIPFLFTYLLYRNRRVIRAMITFDQLTTTMKTSHFQEIAGSLLLFLVFFLYWYGSYTFSPLEYHMLSIPIFIAGLVLIIFNSETLRILAFPIAFLLFLTPPPIEIAAAATGALSTFSSEISYTILKAMGLPVSLTNEYYAPAVVVIARSGSSIPFVIGEASSGIYSLIGFSIFVTFFTYISRGPLWKRALLFFSGPPLIYLLNILRIMSLVSIGYLIEVGLPWDLFHTFGGWFLIFLGTVVLLFISEKALKLGLFHVKPTSQTCNECLTDLLAEMSEHFCKVCGKLLNPPTNKLHRRDIFKLIAIFLSIALAFSIQVPVFALSQGPPEALVQTSTGIHTATNVLPTVPGYKLQFLYEDTKIEKLLKQDAALVYNYVPSNTTYKFTDVISVSLEIADSKTKLSHWEYSLVTMRERQGLKPVVSTLELRQLELLENPPILARFFAFQWMKTNITQIVIYWRESTLFKINSTYQQKYTQISVTSYIQNLRQYKQAEDKLVTFARTIINYWQPIKAWSQLSLLLSQKGDRLVAITTAFLTVVIIRQDHEKRRGRTKNASLYTKLPLTGKQTIDAVRQTEKATMPTLSNIAATYQNTTHMTIEKEELLSKLIKAQKIGLITRQIVNQQDEPIQIWKTNLSTHKKTPSLSRLARNLLGNVWVRQRLNRKTINS